MTDGLKLAKILLVRFVDMNQKAKFSTWSLMLSSEKVELK